MGQKSQAYLQPVFKIADSEIEGEIVGSFAGDGSCCKKSDYAVLIHFGLDEIEYAISFSNLLENFFNKKPYFYLRKNKNEIFLRYRHKSIFYFIKDYLTWDEKKTYSVRLKSMNHSSGFIKGFLRGSLDSDGHVDFVERRAVFSGVSKVLLGQVYSFVKKYNFNARFSCYKCKNKSDMHFVVVRSGEFERFLNFVRPRNKKRSGAGGRFGI